MIRTLTGTIQAVEDTQIVIDVHDVGYLVSCLAHQNKFEPGQAIMLHTYLVVRENALDLYGFAEKSELEMFELLLKAPKIGPKSALQILNQAPPPLLAQPQKKHDPVYLQKLSGIGKKTAENIVSFLNNKKDLLPESISSETEEIDQIQTDAIDALVSLGYDLGAARETILNLAEADSTVNSLVTRALKQM
jgi:Holliday junction DNA helicase RuvA